MTPDPLLSADRERELHRVNTVAAALRGLLHESAQAAFPIQGDGAEARWLLDFLGKRGYVLALSSPETTPAAQETIQTITGDYLDTLSRMVADGRKRKDPTLAVALSIETLGLLVQEVLAARETTPAGVLDETHPLTEPVSPLVDVTHREPVGEAPSQGGVTGSVSCGAVMATCRNEPGHDGYHWHPALNGKVVQ